MNTTKRSMATAMPHSFKTPRTTRTRFESYSIFHYRRFCSFLIILFLLKIATIFQKDGNPMGYDIVPVNVRSSSVSTEKTSSLYDSEKNQHAILVKPSLKAKLSSMRNEFINNLSPEELMAKISKKHKRARPESGTE